MNHKMIIFPGNYKHNYVSKHAIEIYLVRYISNRKCNTKPYLLLLDKGKIKLFYGYFGNTFMGWSHLHGMESPPVT